MTLEDIAKTICDEGYLAQLPREGGSELIYVVPAELMSKLFQVLEQIDPSWQPIEHTPGDIPILIRPQGALEISGWFEGPIGVSPILIRTPNPLPPPKDVREQ